MVRCGMCGNKWVPEMLLASIEPPAGLAMMGKGTFIQARVCRQRRKGNGDVNATIVSDALPFLEYELYRQVCVAARARAVARAIEFELTCSGIAYCQDEGAWSERSLRFRLTDPGHEC